MELARTAHRFDALPAPRAPGWTLPARYEAVRVIGTGSMGTVRLARDRQLDRLVAIKTLDTDCGELLARLRREAWLLARLEHPSIVRVSELARHEGRLYLAMEYLAGGNLALARLAPEPLVRTLRGVVDALAHAHDRGVIHRDVKPENLLLTRAGGAGRAVLCDFGLAMGPGEGSPALRRPIVGTPLTMSPEQVDGAPLGPTSDVFSFGVTLYRLATGSWPFRGRTVFDVFDAIRRDEALPARALAPAVPRRLDAIVRKSLAKDPSARFASMHELGESLDRFLLARSLFALSPFRRRRPEARAATDRIHPEDRR